MKGKSVQRKTKATPVILIDESEKLTNTVIISKMINNSNENSSLKPSSNVFSGGFKYRTQQPKNVPNLSTLNQPKIDRMTVYDEFGIINNSIGKKKYREDNKQQGKEPVQVSSTPINNYNQSFSDNNPWKKQNRQIQKNNYVDQNYYQISKLKERQQSAIHVKSSLQVINLQNIEAKLQAHRQTIKPIQQQYNILKGKSTIPQQSNKQRLRFNIDVDKQYNQIQPSKVYELIKETQQKIERPKQDLILQEMWQQKKKNDPKLAEYDFKYQQYLVEKQAKKLIGSVVKDNLFTWDKYAKKQQLQKRKIAKQHKSKQKSYGQAAEHKILDKNKSLSSPNKHQNDQIEQNPNMEEKIASKDDKFIGKYIMAEIDIDKKGIISKDELIDYLSTKDHLIKGYHIDLKWLHTDLDNFQTKRKGVLNQNQVIQFLATLDSLHHPNLVLKEIPKGEKYKKQVVVNQNIAQKGKGKIYVTYFNQNASKFQRIFNLLDIGDDKIIKRQEFIQNIFIDAECNKILDKNAIVFNLIDKSITFRQIISFILDDYRKEKNQKLRKSKQYITLQRFSEYFQIPQSLDLSLIDKNYRQKLKKDGISQQIDLYDIEEQYLVILKDIFDTVPRIYQNYIVINDFVSIALKDPQILAISDQLCRIQSVETKLPVQSIKSVLTRLRKQCDQYGTWEVTKSYFSRRGRPMDWDFDLIQKKKQVRNQKVKERANTVKNLSYLEQGELSSSKPVFELSSKLRNQKKNSIQKYTIPQPFNITDQKKKKDQSIKKLSSQQQQIQQLKKKFKAKPVNAEILQPKPDLIQGKAGKSTQKLPLYNYENYENDRIERVLKKAQEKQQEQQTLKQIKRLAEVKAKDVKIDLNKKLEDVVKEQKKNKEKMKPKPTVPQVSPNLYPQNPKQEAKKKLEKYKQKLQKQQQAAQIREGLKNDIKERAKERNKQIIQTAKQKKKRQQQQQEQRAKLEQNSYKPKINKRNTTQQEKQALKKAREERQRKKMEEQQAIMEALQKKKKQKLSFIKPQTKLQIEGLEDDQILNKIDQVDLEDLLLDQQDKASFRKQFQLKNKTRKQIKQRFNGLAGRQRAAMQAQQKRLADQKRQMKERKQSKVIKQKIQQAKALKNQVNTTMNVDTNFHRSNALRRYRAIMEGKEPTSEYDQYSRMGDPQKNEI